jgi:hypothetical protein
MTLELYRIRERGNIGQERVVLVARDDVDVGGMVLCRTRSERSDIYPDIYDAFWLPDVNVAKGDFVAIYSKAGTTGSKVGTDGKTTHFFYWHRDRPIWDAKDVAAVLMSISTWSFLLPGK